MLVKSMDLRQLKYWCYFVGSFYAIKAIAGVMRPPLSAILPRANGGSTVLLDVGANGIAKPMCYINLVYWALYFQNMFVI